MKKLIIVLLLVVIIPQLAGAQTAINPTILAQLQARIIELTRMIEVLKAQLANQTPSTTPAWIPIGDNKPPVITSVSGPTSLGPNASGVWQVAATDPEGSALTYTVTWGDLSTPTIQSTNSFSHFYSTPGNYYLTFVVTDRGGKSVRGNAAVFVSTREVSAITGNADISVVDNVTDQKLIGASITLINLSAQPAGTGVTRADSDVIFNNLPVGVYTAGAVAVGYKVGQITFTVVRDQTVKPVVRLEKIPVLPLTVSVKSSNDSALKNASVMIYNESGLVATRLTNDAGLATFSNLPSGHTYRAEITRLGYAKPNSQSTTLSGGVSTSLNFILNPIH